MYIMGVEEWIIDRWTVQHNSCVSCCIDRTSIFSYLPLLQIYSKILFIRRRKYMKKGGNVVFCANKPSHIGAVASVREEKT